MIGAVNVGPLECMPSKVVEAQLLHAAEEQGLLSLTLSVNGDAVSADVLDSFVQEIKTRRRAAD